MCTSYILVLTIISVAVEGIGAHGRMNDPPGRSTMWRMGFNTPPNYNDMEVYCGGLVRLWDTNGGRCGVCGDAFDLPEPRDNEAGGKYGNGIIVRNYQQGQAILVKIQLTANHGGYFEFRLCPTNSPNVRATEECMNQYVLQTDQGTTYHVVGGQSDYNIRVYLPSSLYCSQCVFRWKYYAAQHVGHGKRQEHFYSCADISIQRRTYRPDTTTPKPWTPTPWTPKPWTPTPWTPTPWTPTPWTPTSWTPKPWTPKPWTPTPPTPKPWTLKPWTPKPWTPTPWTPKPWTPKPWTPKPTPSIDSRPPCNNICIYYCRISKVVCSRLCKYCRLP